MVASEFFSSQMSVDPAEGPQASMRPVRMPGVQQVLRCGLFGFGSFLKRCFWVVFRRNRQPEGELAQGRLRSVSWC